MTDTNQLPPLPTPKFTEMIRGVPCITVTEHEHLMRAYALQARAQVQGEAEATHQAAERYLWLRDGFHKGDLRKTRRPSDAPYVVNPQKSVLYGIEAYRGQELDRAIDEDRLNDLAQHIYEEALVNGDSRFSEPDFRFSDEFANECLDKARAAMATTPQPAQATQAGVTDATINHVVYEHTKLNPNQASDVELLTYIRNAVRAILAMRPAAVPMTDEVFDLICNAIDKADTISMEGDYMLDSDDCIAVVRVMQALLSIHHGITTQRAEAKTPPTQEMKMRNIVRWCVEEADTGLPVASGRAQTPDEAYREMMHYVAQYSQDGEVRFWMRKNRTTIKAGTWPATVRA